MEELKIEETQHAFYVETPVSMHVFNSRSEAEDFVREYKHEHETYVVKTRRIFPWRRTWDVRCKSCVMKVNVPTRKAAEKVQESLYGK